MIDPISVENGFYWVKLTNSDEWRVIRVFGIFIDTVGSDYGVELKEITTWGPKIEPPDNG